MSYWKIEVKQGKLWKFFQGIQAADIHCALNRVSRWKDSPNRRTWNFEPADWRVRPSTRQEINKLELKKAK